MPLHSGLETAAGAGAVVLTLRPRAGPVTPRTSLVSAQIFVNPEDAKAFKGEAADNEASPVARAIAAHRNALENIPIFAILGLLYLTTGGSETGAMAYFVTFTVSRWLHTFAYLAGLQPWRTLFYAIGWLVNVGLSVQLAVAALA